MFEIGSGFMQADGAKLYKECGQQEKYITYVKAHLKDKEEPYLEVINYYKEKDPEKSAQIAELGFKKCKDSQTGIITFLIQNARNSGDKEQEAKLIKSAKMRRSVDFEKVKEALN